MSVPSLPPSPMHVSPPPEPQMHTLESIPPEILSTIAYYLAISPLDLTPDDLPSSAASRKDEVASIASTISPTCSSKPTLTPAPLVPLLTASRTIHSTLAFTDNPHLYARIFEDKFDVAAVRRRLGQEEINDGALAGELRTRCVAMRNLKEAVRRSDTGLFGEQDIYTVYLMLLENDGKNLKYLLSPAAGSPLLAFLFLYHDRDLVQKATGPGLPPHTLVRTLVLWIIWLLTSPQGMEKEELEDIEEFLFCLRPYVFAARQFEVTFAPWTLMDLPLRSSAEYTSATNDLPPPSAYNPYIADPVPRSRLIHIEHYGRPRALCAPVLAHAAILNFFARIDRLLGTSRFETADAAGLTGGMDGPAPAPRTEEGGREPVQPVPGNQQVVVFRPRRSSRYVAYTPAKRSEIHDADFKRLTRCYDPNVSPGMGIEDWYGRFTGCWEGSFSFFDYDAYKSMLSGESRALYEGQFGEQTQVWRLQEVFVRPKREGAHTTGSRRSPNSSPLNAGFDLHSSTFDQLIPLMTAQAAARGSFNTFNASNTGFITSAVIKMLENDVREDYLVAMLGGLEGMQVVHEEELRGIMKRRRGEEYDEDGVVPGSANAKGKQKSDAREGDDLELMLVGTGHSAWGDFLLRGRVRLWDGLVTLVKEYSPDGRGRWLYRGYVVGNNVFVGRWRDCVTPQDFVGYEGTFTLAQRIDEAEAGVSDIGI